MFGFFKKSIPPRPVRPNKSDFSNFNEFIAAEKAWHEMDVNWFNTHFIPSLTADERAALEDASWRDLKKCERNGSGYSDFDHATWIAEYRRRKGGA
jgi:hypothetical protein